VAFIQLFFVFLIILVLPVSRVILHDSGIFCGLFIFLSKVASIFTDTFAFALSYSFFLGNTATQKKRAK